MLVYMIPRISHISARPRRRRRPRLVRGARSLWASPPALTCLVCIKESQSLLIMSVVSPDKRRKMETSLEQLKKYTVVVADTGDFKGN